jgi:hypothetical protein
MENNLKREVMSVRKLSTKSNKAWDAIIECGQREFDPQETMHILTANKPIYWSWGVSNGICTHKVLALKVNGHHHKGWVVINLMWEDLYRVTLISTHGNIKNQSVGLYFDQLVEWIDNKIEKIEAYQN